MRRVRAAVRAGVLFVALTASLSVPTSAAYAVYKTPPSKAPHVSPPSAVKAKAGGTGTIARIAWREAIGAASYRVWRSTRSLAGFEPIGSSSATSFVDASGVPNRTYYYQITSVTADGDESSASTPTAGVKPEWNLSPHATYGKGNLCMTCHGQHRGDDGPRGGEVTVCYSCHDGQGASTNVKDGPEDSFGLASGHRIEEATRSADLTNQCSSCHSPHADPRKRPGLYAKRAGKRAVASGNAWCAACHDDASSWNPGYPARGTEVRDANGYPVLGTYPGPTVYAATKKTGHAGIAGNGGGPKGDCLLCHAAHRGPNAYDGLLLQYRPTTVSTIASDRAEGTYAQLCLQCHGGGAWAKRGAVDIKRYVTAARAQGRAAGHSIVTSGGTLPVGAPVPCYDCHNPHGSARGNTSLLSDALGTRLTTSRASAVRGFCLSCHATTDGLVWDSVGRRYSAVGTATVEGLRRDGADGSLLRLRTKAEAHAGASTASCYSCHGSDYASADGNNVHAPKWAGRTPNVAAAPKPVPATKEKTSTVPATVE